MRRLEEQNSLSRYASMALQILSHRDGVRRRTNEGSGEVTSFPGFVRLPPVPGLVVGLCSLGNCEPAVQSSPVRKVTSCLSAVREGYVGLKGVPVLTLAPLTGATSSLTTYSVSQSDCGHTSSTREFASYHRINRNETTAMESSVTDYSLGADSCTDDSAIGFGGEDLSSSSFLSSYSIESRAGSSLLASLMAVTKEQAIFPPIHQTATLDLAPLAPFTHSFRNIREKIRSSVGLFLSPRATALRLAEGKEVF
ncbi:unnamed protein product [Dovyalis caffra]|uniref:Uncharacterized protein n=1 Tax=Dovyalis caffra TaxID=77055 RepID=A0AAV1QTS1_9ROSI|nr:unnamed protein product [Dovyalis caffra]